jgi:hypothetical protein
MKAPHVFIATPMYGGNCSGLYVSSLVELQILFANRGISFSMEFLFNESLITRARNLLTHNFLNSQASHLFFIDSDIKFSANDVLSMISADKDVICGVYPKKEINWSVVRNAVVNNVPDDQLKFHTGGLAVNLMNHAQSMEINVNEPVEILHGCTGFMMIKRNVFEKLSDHVPSYRPNLNYKFGSPDVFHKDFFSLSLDPTNKLYLSEDYHFCQMWRNIGGEVFAAPWIKLSHIGMYEFSGAII